MLRYGLRAKKGGTVEVKAPAPLWGWELLFNT